MYAIVTIIFYRKITPHHNYIQWLLQVDNDRLIDMTNKLRKTLSDHESNNNMSRDTRKLVFGVSDQVR